MATKTIGRIQGSAGIAIGKEESAHAERYGLEALALLISAEHS